jgi:hypothetical protein
MLFKNRAGQGVYLYAHDMATDSPKTGDWANITATVSKDGGSATATATTHPTEIGGGVYWLPLSQTETNAGALALAFVSATSNVQIAPVIAYTEGGSMAELDGKLSPIYWSETELIFEDGGARLVTKWMKDGTAATPTNPTVTIYPDDGTSALLTDRAQTLRVTGDAVWAECLLSVPALTSQTGYVAVTKATIDGASRAYVSPLKAV